jgi:hypothetical protein
MMSWTGPTPQTIIGVWTNTVGRPTTTLRGQIGVNDSTGQLEWWNGSGMKVAGPPTGWVSVTGLATNTNMTTDAVQTRVEANGAVGRIRGLLSATGTVAANAVLFTIGTVGRPVKTQRIGARKGTVNGTLTINTSGTVTLNQSFGNGDALNLDGLTWDLG